MNPVLKTALLGVWSVLRYFLFSSLFMLFLMCLFTGQFPPPIGKMYHDLRALQAALTLQGSTQQLLEVRMKNEKMLESLDDDQKNLRAARQADASGLGADADSATAPDARDFKARFASLEAEVISLRADLRRSQQEIKVLN